MTRINLVPVTELCDQHLLAEHREITRIPNCVLTGKLRTDYTDLAPDYVLGAGHVKFFTNKLGFLKRRYHALYEECKRRGFNVAYNWKEDELRVTFKSPPGVSPFEDYKPTKAALAINRERIKSKMPLNPRFTKHKENSCPKKPLSKNTFTLLLSFGPASSMGYLRRC